MKFDQNQKSEFKKSIEFYRLFWLKVWTKFGLNFCPFFMDESERNEAKGLFMLKQGLFLPINQIEEILN